MPQQPPGVGAPPPMPGQPPAGPPQMPGQQGMPGQPYGQGHPPHMQQGWPGQQMHAGYPGYPGAGMGRQPNSGSPVGAFFLGLLASFVIAAIYTAINAATLAEMSYAMVNTLLIGHALVNGAVVGWLVGLVGRRNTGAHIGGAVVAVLGAFFGFTNSIPFVMGGSGGFHAFLDMMKFTPMLPVKIWWGTDAVGHLLSILSLLAAAGAAWGVAHAVGGKRG